MEARKVYIALRKACMSYPFDAVVEFVTWSNLVHSEIRLGPVSSYAAYKGETPCFLEQIPKKHPHPEWEVFMIPVTDYDKASEFVQAIVNAKLPYRMPWDCLFSQCILKEFDTDLDCTRPETWGSIFCSQSSLLFLRRCAQEGILSVVNTRPLFECDSKGVSPVSLYRIMLEMGLRPLPG